MISYIVGSDLVSMAHLLLGEQETALADFGMIYCILHSTSCLMAHLLSGKQDPCFQKSPERQW